MSFRLKEAVYKVRCREPGCTFFSEFAIKENLMGVTESDVDTEAIRIAKNMAFIKHDALLGRKHQLANPEVFKITGTYERIGGMTESSVFSPNQSVTPKAAPPAFQRGDVILKKQEDSALIIEVVHGSAENLGHPGLRYRPGAMAASAAVFHQRSRPADIVAAEDNTVVTFHDVKELTRTNPARARELFDRAMEDVFRLMMHLEDNWASLDKQVKKLKSRPVRKAGPGRTTKKTIATAQRKRPTAKRAAKTRRPVRARKA